MAEIEIERYGCAVCGRTQTVRMGDRGPVKEELRREWIGNFMFCVECVAAATQTVERRENLECHVLTMTSGPMAGHRWITTAR